ncbi:MAG: hypothetical protein HUU15_06430 [Candidatus Brocadiae bacterium]|nr:hypothetical protein [Candidatus Brocadiia bacterium]
MPLSRLLTSSLLLCAAAASALEPDPAGDPTATAPQSEIERLVELLDADGVEERTRAEEALGGMGPAALESIRGAAAVARLENEGQVRLARVLRLLEARVEETRIWGEDADPLGEVRSALTDAGQDLENWELHLIADPGLTRLLPRCRFIIADWVGAQRKPIASVLYAVCREPAAVLRIPSSRELVALAPSLPAAQDGAMKARIAGALAGLESLRSQWDGPFEYRPEDASVPEGAAGATRIAETGQLVFDFDESGTLVQVATVREMQRKR